MLGPDVLWYLVVAAILFATGALGVMLAGLSGLAVDAGATTGAWPGVQSFGGWKGSGSTGKAGLGPWYVAQFLREQSRTVVD